jgi:hypothetical protein
LLLVAVGVVLVWSVLWWRYTFDDTFITLRYAENLAGGNGAVFNPGERIEGYSCPAWVLVLGLIAWPGGDALFFSKLLGLAATVGLLVLLYLALRRSGCQPVIAGAASLWLAVLPDTHTYACSGMETLPFALAVAAASFLPAFRPGPPLRTLLVSAVLLTVATMRPEGILVAAGLSVLWLIRWRERSVRLGLLATWTILVGLAGARYAYYGGFLPNTFLAKPSPVFGALLDGSPLASLGKAVRSMLENVVPAIDGAGGIGVLALAAIPLVLKRSPQALAAALTVALGGFFVFYAPLDWMPGSRFAFPFAAPLIFLAAAGLQGLGELVAGRSAGREERAWWVRVATLVLLAVWMGIGSVRTIDRWWQFRQGTVNKALDAANFAPIGKWLRAHGLPDDSVLAYEIGCIGYYSKLRVIDHEGLVTEPVARTIRRAGGYWKVCHGADERAMREVVRYCVDREPDWFLVRSIVPEAWPPGEPVPPSAANKAIQVALLEELGATMVLRKVFELGPQDRGSERYLLLERRRPADRPPPAP